MAAILKNRYDVITFADDRLITTKFDRQLQNDTLISIHRSISKPKPIPWLSPCPEVDFRFYGCHISTSSLKSDVIIVFLDPDFFNDAKISAIRVHLIFASIFRISWPKMEKV